MRIPDAIVRNDCVSCVDMQGIKQLFVHHGVQSRFVLAVIDLIVKVYVRSPSLYSPIHIVVIGDVFQMVPL